MNVTKNGAFVIMITCLLSGCTNGVTVSGTVTSPASPFVADTTTFVTKWNDFNKVFNATIAKNGATVTQRQQEQNDQADMVNALAKMTSDSKTYANSSGSKPDVANDMNNLVSDGQQIVNRIMGADNSQWNLDMDAFNRALSN